MAEYIEREFVCGDCIHADVCEEAETLVGFSRDNIAYCGMFLNAADVAPLRHGRWESVKNPQWPAYSHDKCSICGWWNTRNALCYDGHKKPGHSLNYCPNCGAKMDLEGGGG